MKEELFHRGKAKSLVHFGAAIVNNFTAKDRYSPFPFDEYKFDPVKMYQNPGYN